MTLSLLPVVAYLGGVMCLAAIAGQALHDNRAAKYAGRHRGQGRMSRKAAMLLAAQTQISRWRYAAYQALLVEPKPFDPEAVKAALREDTASMFLPDFDEGSPGLEYAHSNGSTHYQALRPRALDAKLGMDRRALRLRRSVPLGPETADEWAGAVA